MSLGNAYGPQDVTRLNTLNKLYVVGSEFIDGSIRLDGPEPHENTPHIEARNNGVWNLGELKLGGATLALGENLAIRGAGEFLSVVDVAEGKRGLVIVSPFDDTGTSVVKAPILGPLVEKLIIQGNDVGEIIGIDLQDINTSPVHAIRTAIYVRTGSVGATASVQLTLRKGTDVDGIIFFRARYPSSLFPPNTEIRVPLDGSVDFLVNDSIHSQMLSDQPLSLRVNATNNRWVAIDFQAITFEEILSFSSGTNKILTDIAGHVVLDNTGNIISERPAA